VAKTANEITLYYNCVPQFLPEVGNIYLPT